MNVIIKGFLEETLIDWPGKIACEIFTAGCNFSCSYCHNHDLAKNNPNLREYSREEIFNYLKRMKDWIDGIVISGGEPTMNENIVEFIREIKRNIPKTKIKLDTNGSFPENLETILKAELIDYIAMDIKASREKYKLITQSNIDINKIEKSIELIRDYKNNNQNSFDYEFRTTIVPDLLEEQDLLEIGKWLKSMNANKNYVLQQFLPKNCLDSSLNNKKTYSKEQLEQFKQILQPYFEKIDVRIYQ